MHEHIIKNNHKYIHFVDLQNPKISLCDPYCIGLLKEHLVQLKSFFYPISNSTQQNKFQDHPPILNRFSLESETNELGNFSLMINNKYVQSDTFDTRYIDNFKTKKSDKTPIKVFAL